MTVVGHTGSEEPGGLLYDVPPLPTFTRRSDAYKILPEWWRA